MTCVNLYWEMSVVVFVDVKCIGKHVCECFFVCQIIFVMLM